MDISELRTSLSCPVCKDISPDPWIVQCVSGHNICKTCKDMVSVCPMGCCSYHDPPTRNSVVEELIIKFIILFPCKNPGCDKKFKLIELDLHKETCPQRLVECVNDGCKLTVTPSEMERHTKICGHKLIWCDNMPECQERVKKMNLAEHVGICDHTVIRCEFNLRGCDQRLERQVMREHFGKCGFQPVVCKQNGCHEIVNKSDYWRHNKDCWHRLIKCPLYDCKAEMMKQDDLKKHLLRRHKDGFLTRPPSNVLETEVIIGNVRTFTASSMELFSFNRYTFTFHLERNQDYYYAWLYLIRGPWVAEKFVSTLALERGDDFYMRETGKVFPIDFTREKVQKECIKIHVSVVEKALTREGSKGGRLKAKFTVEWEGECLRVTHEKMKQAALVEREKLREEERQKKEDRVKWYQEEKERKEQEREETERKEKTEKEKIDDQLIVF